jgi:hypothetical protein
VLGDAQGVAQHHGLDRAMRRATSRIISAWTPQMSAAYPGVYRATLAFSLSKSTVQEFDELFVVATLRR